MSMIALARLPSQYKTFACPIMSTIEKDGSVTRVNCIAGACALWDWIARPWPDVPNYFCDDDPARLARMREGFGGCTLPDVCAPSVRRAAA